METSNRPPQLLFDRLAENALQQWKAYRFPMLAAIIFGLLAHGFAFTNKFVIHDEVYNLFGKGATVDSGRWGLGALDSIFPNFSMPWIYGIITIVLIAVSVCLMVHIFSVKNRVLQVLLAGSVVVFPSLTGTFAFMYTSSSYAVSILLAVLSVWLLRKPSVKFWIPALICAVLSVSIYQAYIALIASLLVLALIQDLLNEGQIVPMLRRGCFYVGFLAASLGLYYIATQLVLILKDVHFNDYAGGRVTFSLSSIPANIAQAYACFFQCLNKGECALVPTLFSRRMHWACLICAAVLLVVLLLHQKAKLSRVLFVAALIAVLPLAINCMYLFTSYDSIHTLVLYSFVAVYLLVILVADACLPLLQAQKVTELLRRAALNVSVFCLAAIIVANTYLANEAYLNLHLQYENTYAFYSSLIADIKMMPEFNENTRLAVIGEWEYPDYFFRKFDFSYHLFGYCETSPDFYSKDRFLEYYLGFSIPFASLSETMEIETSPEYNQMPVYPYYGSMRMFGDILVVKLS